MSIFLGSEAEEIGSVFERIGTTKHTHIYLLTGKRLYLRRRQPNHKIIRQIRETSLSKSKLFLPKRRYFRSEFEYFSLYNIFTSNYFHFFLHLLNLCLEINIFANADDNILSLGKLKRLIEINERKVLHDTILVLQ